MIQTLQTRLRLPHLNYLLLEFLLSSPSSQSDKSLQFKLRSEPWFCVSSGIQAWNKAGSSVSFFVLESFLILFLVGFTVECWSFRNLSPKHLRFSVGEMSKFHG